MQNFIFSKESKALGFQKTLKAIPILLLLGDILGLVICLEVSLWLRLNESLDEFIPIFYGFIPLVLMGLYLADTYNPDKQIAGLRPPARIVLSNLIIAGVCACVIYIFGGANNHPFLWRSVLLPCLGTFTVWAVISRLWAVIWMRDHAEQSRWLILGAKESTIKFAEDFLASKLLGRLFVLAEDAKNTTELTNSHLNCVGNITDLANWASQPLSGVLVGTEVKLSDQLIQELMSLRLLGIPVYKLPDFYEALWYKLPSSLLQDTWFVFNTGFNLVPGCISAKLKRIVDVVAVGLLLMLLFPLMILTAVLIKLDSPGKVFYSQMRTGLNSKPFRVYKFRSMYIDAEKRGAQWASQRDPRITRVGYWLRILRIDELPQLWNVLRGEMSLIGPRPERPEFDTKLKQEIPYYELRYLIKPGITGWAQVLYPYGSSIEDAYEKLAYDLYYIKNYSLWLDIAIAFKTFRVVLLGKGR